MLGGAASGHLLVVDPGERRVLPAGSVGGLEQRGKPMAFDQPHRYSARRIRERPDRKLLAAYLTASAQ